MRWPWSSVSSKAEPSSTEEEIVQYADIFFVYLWLLPMPLSLEVFKKHVDVALQDMV